MRAGEFVCVGEEDPGETCMAFVHAGILYTSRPRGDITGTARFVDMKHRLCCEINFGKVAGARDPLLQRSDSLSGIIFRFRSTPPAGVSSAPAVCTARSLFLELVLPPCGQVHEQVLVKTQCSTSTLTLDS